MLIRCEPWTCAVDSLNMGLNYYASSPVLVPPAQGPNSLYMSSQGIHFGPEGGAVLQPAFNLQTAPVKRRPRYPKPPSLNYLARSSTGVAGRKRSRDENDGDSDGDMLQDEIAASSRITTMEQKPQPVLGEGMTLEYPDQPAMSISAESQSGTWVDESINEESQRPQLISRKSLRLTDAQLDLAGVADSNSTENHLAIDPIVRKLGIGWKRLTTDQQTAAAGSETFIRKQFDMYNPRMLLHHEGLSIYVVSSEPYSAPGYWQQYWLFREDLKSCRFLCRDENELFDRLANKRQEERGNWIPDIVCEGPERFAKDVNEPTALPANSPTNTIFGAVVDQQQQMVANADVDMMEI
jgi:hypothetical protein